MRDATSTLSAFDRHSLFEACAREAARLGGDDRTADYFFGRAQSSRVWLSEQGAVTIADMDITDWCSAIAWAAPGVGRASEAPEPKKSPKVELQRAPPEVRALKPEITDLPDKKQPRSGARAKGR